MPLSWRSIHTRQVRVTQLNEKIGTAQVSSSRIALSTASITSSNATMTIAGVWTSSAASSTAHVLMADDLTVDNTVCVRPVVALKTSVVEINSKRFTCKAHSINHRPLTHLLFRIKTLFRLLKSKSHLQLTAYRSSECKHTPITHSHCLTFDQINFRPTLTNTVSISFASLSKVNCYRKTKTTWISSPLE